MAARQRLDLLIFQVSLAGALSLSLRLIAIFLDEQNSDFEHLSLWQPREARLPLHPGSGKSLRKSLSQQQAVSVGAIMTARVQA